MGWTWILMLCLRTCCCCCDNNSPCICNDLYLSPTREVTSQSAVKSKAVFSFVIRILPVIVFHTQALFVPSLSSTQSIFQTYVALKANYLPLFYNYVIICPGYRILCTQYSQNPVDLFCK